MRLKGGWYSQREYWIAIGMIAWVFMIGVAVGWMWF